MPTFEKITTICNAANLKCTDFISEPESIEYNACHFKVKTNKIHFRSAKITPKKEGLFVTFWKRIPSGTIAPFDCSDNFGFLIVEVECKNETGWFVFPKSILFSKKIVSTSLIEGKRAFRIYPPSSVPKSKQATASQKWQSDYFFAKSTLQNSLGKKLNLNH